MATNASFDVLLISASEYRIDGAFRYVGDRLPQLGDLITIVDDASETEREACVRRVDPDGRFAIHATDMTPLAPERRTAPPERSRRSRQEAQRLLNAQRGWLHRRRRRHASGV